LNADWMKIKVIRKFKERNGFEYMATEVLIPYAKYGSGLGPESIYYSTTIGDVVMINGAFTCVYEVEIKRSKDDLKKEFTTKRRKHDSYLSSDGYGPHYYLFAFPEGSGLEKEEIIPDRYGILLINEKEFTWQNCIYKKRAKLLPCQKLDVGRQFKRIAKRAISDAIYLREKGLKEETI